VHNIYLGYPIHKVNVATDNVKVITPFVLNNMYVTGPAKTGRVDKIYSLGHKIFYAY